MSNPTRLPDPVRDFVVRHFDSVAELEATLLLRQAPRDWWDAASLAARLYISVASAATLLDILRRRELVEVEADRARYAPASEGLRSGVETLALAYPRFLIAITQAIHDKPRSAIQEFADAFRLRGDKT